MKHWDSEQVKKQALHYGAELAGVASAKDWEQPGAKPCGVSPRAVFPQAESVVVLAAPLWLPVVDASPSDMGYEQIKIVDSLLNKAAFQLATELNIDGYASVNLRAVHTYRDKEEIDAFSNVWAGYFAGLGTIGFSRNLLTPAYGPRILLASVLTALPLAADAPLEQNLCTRCGNCLKLCPAHAVSPDGALANAACLAHEQTLEKSFLSPCHACVKACPVGKDRSLFHRENMEPYFLEQNGQLPRENETAVSWRHIRSYGSLPPQKTVSP